MRLGIQGLSGGALDSFTPASAVRIREAGFSAAVITLRGTMEELVEQQLRCREVGQMFADAGVPLVGFGQYSTDFISRDPAVRAASVRRLQLASRVAAALGAGAVNYGTGSRNPNGAWFPHPDNESDEALDTFVAGLREVVPAAEDAGIRLTLEPHRNTVCYSPERAVAALEGAGSSVAGVTLDFVNWLESRDVFNAGRAVEHMVDVVRDYVVCIHAKDVQVEDRMLVHYNEAVAGSGGLDFPRILAVLAICDTPAADLPFILEHLKPEEVPAARDHVLAAARAAGGRLEGARQPIPNAR